MGLSHGTVKAMKDPEAQKEETASNIASSESVSEGERWNAHSLV
jgi:hypothetical protein